MQHMYIVHEIQFSCSVVMSVLIRTVYQVLCMWYKAFVLHIIMCPVVHTVAKINRQ